MKRDENRNVEYKESWHDTIKSIKRLEPPSRVRFLLRAARYGGQDGASGALRHAW